MNDDRRRSRAGAFLGSIHFILGDLDQALASGTRAQAIAERLGDLELRILTTSILGGLHYQASEFERAVELAMGNLAALPAEWVYKVFGFGAAVTASVSDRCSLVRSLAQLGRFAEAAEPAAEVIRLAEPTRHAYTVGWAHYSADTLPLLKGEWAKARALLEHGLAVFREGNVAIPRATISCSAWVLAQLGEWSEATNRLRECEEVIEQFAASGHEGYASWGYHATGRAYWLLGRLDEARSLGERAVESDPCHSGFAAHALHLLGDITTHPDRFDAESGEAYYRRALALAEPCRMRPLVAHCHLGLGKLYRRAGKREQAHDHLATATAMYREMDMSFWLENAGAEMEELA